MIGYALSQRGSRYTWGGAGPYALGYDCSGLVLQAIYAAGYDPQPINVLKHAEPTYRTSQQLYANKNFQSIPINDRQRGDLIFYGPDGSQSVALFLGNGQMLESTPPAVVVSPVRTDSMAPYLSRIIEWQ